MEVPPGTFVDEKAARYFYLEHRLKSPSAVRQLHAKGTKKNRWLNALVANFVHIAFHKFESIQWDPFNVARLVVDAHHENSIMRIGYGRDFVG
jgi:hypothetical protein